MDEIFLVTEIHSERAVEAPEVLTVVLAGWSPKASVFM